MLLVVPQSFESMLFYILYYVWENFLRIIPMNCFCGWNIFNDSQSSQSSHCTTPTLSKLLIVTWVCWVHLGHLALRFSENSGTRCWRRRWGPSSTVPVPWRQCAARGTCWRPPSDLEDLEAPSSPAQRWHGCRFGSDVSDVSCFGMFWKSLIFSGWSHSHADHTNQSFSRFKRDCKAAQRWQQSLNLEDPLCVQIRATEGQLV